MFDTESEGIPQEQGTAFVYFLREVVREVQSPRCPMFKKIPALTDLTSLGNFSLNFEGCGVSGRGKTMLNPEFMSEYMKLPSNLVKRNQMYYTFGQILGISWRCEVLLPLFVSTIIWKGLVGYSLYSQ